jgi:hypothetical protein
MITRRSLITQLIAAPAIVRCASLMSLRGVSFVDPVDPADALLRLLEARIIDAERIMRHVIYTGFYMTDEAPRQFTGFRTIDTWPA